MSAAKHGVRRGAHLSGALARARPSSVHVHMYLSSQGTMHEK